MSAVFTMTVEYADGRRNETRVLPVTQVAFERKFKMAFVAAFNVDTPQLEHLYFIAWHASRTGIEFDDWLETVVAIDPPEGAESADPTPPTDSAGV
jgi:hypothetical protein